MRPIHKFILHVVHNWKSELNEAYNEGTVKKFIEKFREEADDLNIQITDEELKIYIQRFDVLKNSPKIAEKDLNKWSIGQLIRLVTASKGAETEEDIPDTPDIVYNENGITVWNGSKEDNCIRYGQGEKWCITRGSYGNYRYRSEKGYPTFYLAKNSNLSDSDKLSFVAIQVRDKDEDMRYVYTNRQNSPHESEPMSFDELMSEVPWLRDIPNIKNILKHIPLSRAEKVTQLSRNNSIGIREWMKLPFEAKKQYLVIRKDKSELFDDITNGEFVSKYLPKYPQIANFVAITPGIISTNILLSNLDKFDNQDKKSIISNLRDKVNTNNLRSDTIPFDAKKLLTYLDKWELSSNERLYVTKDGSTIVRLKLGDTVSVSLYQTEDDYPNIKLNQRTSKYLLDYPELDKIPLKNLIKLSNSGAIDKNVIKKVLDNAKTDSNSAIAVKDVDGKEIVIDSNSFASYQVDKDGNLVPVAFDSEEVQKAFAGEKDNESFQQNAISLVKTAVDENENLPPALDKDAFMAVLRAAPYDKRKIQRNNGEYIILPLTGEGENETSIIIKSTDKSNSSASGIGRNNVDWRVFVNGPRLKENAWREYFAFMRNENQVYNDDELMALFRQSSYIFDADTRISFIKSTPPIDPTGRYTVAYSQASDTAYIINKQNPRESFKISDRSGKLVKANISPALARQLTGATPDQATPTAPGAQAPEQGVRRRGRPAGGGAPAAPAAPAADGGVNVTQRMQETGLETAFMRLPRADYRRLAVTNAASILPSTDRGASRRNNQLGNRGRVTSVLSVGASKIYFIRLANGTNVASINVQPGNRNYVLFGNEQGNVAQALNSPSELLQALQNRNLAEMRRVLTQEYLLNNPTQIEEVRGLIQQHIAETRNQ